MKTHHLNYASDLNGRYLVGVQLANRLDMTAWLYRADYEILMRVYSPSEWLLLRKEAADCLCVGFYLDQDTHRILSVAQAIAGEHSAANVSYNDGDLLNLRRNNLSCVPRDGGAKLLHN